MQNNQKKTKRHQTDDIIQNQNEEDTTKRDEAYKKRRKTKTKLNEKGYKETQSSLDEMQIHHKNTENIPNEI